MTGLILGFVAIAGLVLGSFANVVIARVPEGQSVSRPRSSCPHCGHQIRNRDNIPVLSWVLLRAHCRDCRAPISWQYPLVELTVALGFVAVAAILGVERVWLWPAAFYAVFLAVTLSLIDLAHHRLPNLLTYQATPVLLALLGVGAWAYEAWDQWITAQIGALVLGLVFAVLWLIYPRGMGLGDVKLAPAIGALLGWAGLGMLAFGTYAMFLLGGAVGVGLIVARRAKGADTKNTGLPFGPFMFAGVVAAVLVGRAVLDWYAGFALNA